MGGPGASDPSQKRGDAVDVDGGEKPLTPQESARISSVGKVIDEAQKQLRGGDVDPALLKDLGMTPQQFRTFVEQYTQRLEKMKRDPAETPDGRQWVGYEGPGGRTTQGGKTLDSQMLDVRGGEKLTPDQLRKLQESPTAKVSPEYRKQVEDYFRAISEGAAGGIPPAGGSTPTPASGPAK